MPPSLMLMVEPDDTHSRAKGAKGLGGRRSHYLAAYHGILLQFQNGTELGVDLASVEWFDQID